MSTSSSPGVSTRGDDLLVRITEAVAESAGTDESALPHLERTIDTEALVAVLDADTMHDLTFSYYDHLVTVTGDGHVQVTPDSRR